MEERPESLEELLRGARGAVFLAHGTNSRRNSPVAGERVCEALKGHPCGKNRQSADGRRWAGEAEAASLAMGKKEFGFYLGVNGQSLKVLK